MLKQILSDFLHQADIKSLNSDKRLKILNLRGEAKFLDSLGEPVECLSLVFGVLLFSKCISNNLERDKG